VTDELGPRVRAARTRHGLSQAQLAERAGVALRTVRNVEAGRVGAPRERTATALLVGSGALCTVRVLGPVEIDRAGDTAPVGSTMEAAVLTVLAASHGEIVPRTELASTLWPHSRPASWSNLVQTYVSRLRRRLVPDPIPAFGSGYRLDVAPARIDAVRFRDAVAPGRTADAATLERALREWRGPIGSVAAAHASVAALASARIEAAVRFARLAPEPAAAVELLAPIAAEHPAHHELSRAFAALVHGPALDKSDVDGLAAGELLAIRLLGPVSASVAGTGLRVAGTFGRTVLAALALEPGRTVSADRLIQLLWDGRPPATAREQVHTQVYRLRRALGAADAADALDTVPAGYRLRAERVETDIAAATATLARARAALTAGRPADAVAGYRHAEELWRGSALGGVTAELARAHGPRLTEWRQAITEERIAAALDCEPPAALLPELDSMIETYPLREELHRLRMVALYRAGRRGDALRAFSTVRAMLRRELGLDPSHALQELEAEILKDGSGSPAVPDPVPAQLPPSPSGFAGRVAEVDVLHRLLTSPPDAARVAVLSGMPGIGKTALVVHAAARTTEQFPDGCLYADLHGAAGTPRTPFGVLGDLLRSLGVSPARLADDVAGRAGELRTRTAGRRVLLVLDDALDERQVEPLLLAGSGCATVITSRSRLPGLDARCRVTLAPLADDAARDVLVGCAGADRVAEDPAAVAEIVRSCAGMPLALRITGARLASRPDLTVADVAARLRDAGQRLGELTAGPRSVGASLAGSHRLLSTPARDVLAEVSRLGAGVATWMVAALLGVRAGEAVRVVDELVGLHMLEAAASPAGLGPRYRPHDLVRVYAAAGGRIARDVAVLERLLVRAVAIAATARTTLTGAPPSAFVHGLVAHDQASEEWSRQAREDPERWFAAERVVLHALVHAGAECGLVAPAAALLESSTSFLVRLNMLDEIADAADTVAAAAAGAGPEVTVSATISRAQAALHRAELTEVCLLLERVLPHVAELSESDPTTAAIVWSMLAVAREGREDISGAVDALHRALVCYRRLDDTRGRWVCHTWLARIDETHRDRLEDADEHTREAVRLANALGDWRAISMTLVQAGRVRLRLGDHAGAAARAEQALELVTRHDDPVGEVWCLVLAADVARHRGRLDDAHRMAGRARSNGREAGRPDAEAAATVLLAAVELARGDLAAARAAATAALALHDRFDSPVERRDAQAMLAAVDAAAESTRAGER
jgi:DNA-binding SARP family transcriptional activator/tetratricopeptide (TPR) repeat protein/DNA-binding XRE family transcriptional regulator